ncbi:MAG: hypothetical protein IPK76_01160 [Lewinellaceae bacterium]|nr:hypothetical protein [Lewinellaceae bacterium]
MRILQHEFFRHLSFARRHQTSVRLLTFCYLLSLGFTHPITAQITITNSVFPAVGDTLHYAFGNQPGAINQIFTPPGFGQQWDLSGLQPTQLWDQIMKNPQVGVAKASFPGASILYNPPNSGNEVYLQVTGNQVFNMGYFGLDELGLGLNLLFDNVPNLEETWAPINFFDLRQSSSNVLTAFDAPIAPPVLLNLVPTADSFRIRVTYQRISSIDASGTLAIPGGTFDVLRKKQTEYKSTAVDVKVAPLGWIDISTIGGQQVLPLGTDTITTFHFLNDVSKEAIAICTLNTAQNAVTGVQYKFISNCPTITFTATPTNTCPGSNNGQIVVSGVSGGTGPYMYSKDNGANFQSGATFTGLSAGNWAIVVKDANDCIGGPQEVLVGTFTAPSCSISGSDFVCNNTSGITYTAPPGMSAYNWSISGNGSIPGSTTGQSVSVTSGNYLDNYTVFVTITDANGCTSTCSKQSFNYLFTPPANITVNPNPACFGVTLDLSIAAAASSTVAWSGEGITDPDGNFVPDGFGGFYNQTTALPTSPGSKTYSVSVTADNGCSNTSSVNITVNACGPSGVEISGTIIWETNGSSGVKDVHVALSGDATDNDLTPVDGTYTLTASSGSNFTVTPTKSINKFNGVTAADVAAIQQHVANINPITNPYKQVAADVNKSNSITSLDASIVYQALLGNPLAINQFKTPWRFVPVAHTMNIPPWGFPEKIVLTGVSGILPNQDFFGVKTGDIVAAFANPANFGAGNPLVFKVHDQVLQTGAEVLAEFRADQLEDLAAFQFALHFDPTQLQLAAVTTADGGALPLTMDNFGLYHVSEGEIRAVWSQAEGLFVEEATSVFSLKFNVLEGGGKLSEALSLDEDALPGHAYNSALAESGVQLNFLGTTGTGGPASASGLQLLQNRPNPFVDETTIGFVLPEGSGCDVQLRLFDATRGSYGAATSTILPATMPKRSAWVR